MPTLTEQFIKDLEAPERGQKIVYDDHRDAPRGFGLRFTAGGSKGFILRYRSEGKERRLTVGAWPTWSLSAARKQATEFKRQVDAGTDILEKRRKDAQDPTMAEAIEDFCKAHADKLTSGPVIRSSLERHLKHLKRRKLRSITRRDIIDTVEGLAEKHGRTAALLLTYVKNLFAWAEDREIINANPVATIKPGKVSRNMRPVQRGRVLINSEIQGLWTDLEGIHRLTLLALRLILVTGQRPGEVAGMRRDEISGDIWTIPAARRGKTGTAHAVPLTETAQAILEQVKEEAARLAKRRKTEGAGYVFEARPGKPISSAALGKAVGRYVKELGNLDADTWGHWTPHDLRRTMRTGLAACGVGDTVAEMTIGHTRKGIQATYDLHRYDAEKRMALEAWERHLIRVIEGKINGENVVPMMREVV